MPKQKSQLNKEVNRIAELVDYINEQTGEDITVDYNSAYGGYRIVHKGDLIVFGEHNYLEKSLVFGSTDSERLGYREMVIRLQGIADGINYAINR